MIIDELQMGRGFTCKVTDAFIDALDHVDQGGKSETFFFWKKVVIWWHI